MISERLEEGLQQMEEQLRMVMESQRILSVKNARLKDENMQIFGTIEELGLNLKKQMIENEELQMRLRSCEASKESSSTFLHGSSEYIDISEY
jgi:hypothetical protein